MSLHEPPEVNLSQDLSLYMALPQTVIKKSPFKQRSDPSNFLFQLVDLINEIVEQKEQLKQLRNQRKGLENEQNIYKYIYSWCFLPKSGQISDHITRICKIK